MKRFRYNKIKEIIQTKAIETQEELAQALVEEGITVTQATVSRDIKELMLIKFLQGMDDIDMPYLQKKILCYLEHASIACSKILFCVLTTC